MKKLIQANEQNINITVDNDGKVVEAKDTNPTPPELVGP